MSAEKAGPGLPPMEPREAYETLTCPRDAGWERLGAPSQTQRSRPQGCRSCPGVSAAAAATPRSATCLWTAQVRGAAREGGNRRDPGEGLSWRRGAVGSRAGPTG